MPTATTQLWYFEARVIPEQIGWHVYCPSVFGSDSLDCDGSGNRMQLAGERLYEAIRDRLEQGEALPNSDDLQAAFLENGYCGTWHIFCLRREGEELAWWWLEEGMMAIKEFVDGCYAILNGRSVVLHELAALPLEATRLRAQVAFCLSNLVGITALLDTPSPPEHLRGNPFIAEKVATETGRAIPRTCRCCLFGTRDGEPTGSCQLVNKEAHADFFVPPSEDLPSRLDGKEVGHYCRRWLRFDAD